MPKSTVGTPLWPVQHRYYDPSPVGALSLLKNAVRADLYTEIAALAPGLVNGEFHGFVSYLCSR